VTLEPFDWNGGIMMKVIYLYLLTIPIFFAIDMIWLGFVAKGFYRNNLGHLLRPEVNWTAAIIFYLLYIIGILIFATMPALDKNSPWQAVLLGGLFGFFAYATYDLTNLATLKDWPVIVVWVDIAWGVFLTASVATASFFIGRWLMP
jgi:uncharacterized membrane protein